MVKHLNGIGLGLFVMFQATSLAVAAADRVDWGVRAARADCRIAS